MAGVFIDQWTSSKEREFMIPPLKATAETFERRRGVYCERLASENHGASGPGLTGMPVVACLVFEALWGAPGTYRQTFGDEDGQTVTLIVPPLEADDPDKLAIVATKTLPEFVTSTATLYAGGLLEIITSTIPTIEGEERVTLSEEFQLSGYSSWPEIYDDVCVRCSRMSAWLEEV